jgi:glycerol-1-phosphate dehydrogenase [NAD(P)+]
LMGPMDDIFLASAGSIHDRSPQGMEILAKLIALGGLAMSLSHATTPMSGYEHVMSHILDMNAEMAHQPLAQHGTQVSLATLLAAGAYQHFLQEFTPQEVNLPACYPTAAQMEETIRQTFLQVDPSGKVGEECWADYRLKLETWHAQRETFTAFLKDWLEIRGKLAAWSRTPERLLEIMVAIDAPLKFTQMVPPVSEAQARFAFMNSPLMRKRLTLGDVLIYLNWDRESLWNEVWSVMK